MILVYWFGGVAVGFCAAIALLCMGWKTGFVRRVAQSLWLASLAIGIPLAISWRVSKEIIAGQGGALFAALEQSPVYTLSLGVWDIPIQNVVYLNSWNDLREVIFQSRLPVSLLILCGLFVCNPIGWKKRWGWIVVLVVALGIPTEPALVWDGGWFVSGRALLQSVFSPLPRCVFPHRMVVAPILCMGLVVSLSYRAFHDKLRHPFLKMIAMVLTSGWMFSQALDQFPTYRQTTTSHMTPDSYLIAATKKWPGGIITIPLEEDSDTVHIQQMFHKQPILVGPGMDVVQPPEHEEYCAQNSFLQALEKMGREDIRYSPYYEPEDLEKLWNDGFRLLYIRTNRTKCFVGRW